MRIGVLALAAALGACEGGDAACAGLEAEGTAARTSALRAVYAAPGGDRTITYVEVSGLVVAEGDILLDRALLREVDEALGQAEQPLAAIGTRGRRWANGVVPFRVQPGVRGDRLARAMALWEAVTPIRFVPRDGHDDWVEVLPGPGCRSHVGRVGGRQPMYLAPGCGLRATVHELGHVIGLWHEQSRPDRDDHVRVRWENVQPGHRHAFRRFAQTGSALLGLGPYDLDSVMHYGAYTFSCNGEPTLVQADSGDPVPPRRPAPSEGDVEGVRALYE